MKMSDNILEMVEKAIHFSEAINIEKENLEVCMNSNLPYVLLHRYHNEPPDKLKNLLKSISSSLMVRDDYDNLEKTMGEISGSISKKFNSFLILELMISSGNKDLEIFSLFDHTDITTSTLQKALEDMETNTLPVTIREEDESPLKPPLNRNNRKDNGVFWIGLNLPASLFTGHNSESLIEQFTDAFKKVIFKFIRIQTSNHFSHYLMHDNDKLDDNVKRIDKELADVSEEMNFLLNTTPVNENAAWEEFKSRNFKKEPQFTYRMIKFDPEKVKERLFDLDMDGIKGTTIDYILRQKRIQLEIELTLLQSREAVGAKFLGHYLYSVPDEKEMEAAWEILDNVKDDIEEQEEETVSCHEFAEIAQPEIDYLRSEFKNKSIATEVRNDIVGLMVNKTTVYISEGMSIKKSRVAPLIQHEIGTHILTYCNGLRQPIKQLYTGFAGYNTLQEGLAVLSEYFVGGLTASRLRLLAARVVAVDCLVKGKTFTETYSLLVEKYNFPKELSFNLTMRIYRGGGLIKDTVYLRGVLQLLKYLQNGGNLELLFTGKFALHYVPLISKFLDQGVLKEPILPNHFKEKEFQNRIEALRNEKFKLLDLIT